MAHRFDAVPLRTDPWVRGVALRLAVSHLERADERLRSAGVERVVRPESILVPPHETCGVVLELVAGRG